MGIRTIIIPLGVFARGELCCSQVSQHAVCVHAVLGGADGGVTFMYASAIPTIVVYVPYRKELLSSCGRQARTPSVRTGLESNSKLNKSRPNDFGNVSCKYSNM